MKLQCNPTDHNLDWKGVGYAKCRGIGKRAIIKVNGKSFVNASTEVKTNAFSVAKSHSNIFC
jgi:hypothetical protein